MNGLTPAQLAQLGTALLLSWLTDRSRGRLMILLAALTVLVDRRSLLRIVGSRVLAGGSGRHMSSLQDLKPVLARRVFHGDLSAIVSDVAVLADPLSLGPGLLPEDDAVLLGVGRAEPAIAGVESLLFQDLGTRGVDKSTGRCGNETGSNNKLKHFYVLTPSSEPLARLKFRQCVPC